MKYGIYAIALFFLSCSTEISNPDYKDLVETVEHNTSGLEMWICHHPGSEFHGKQCVDEAFPNGCYVPGDGSKFCWLLQDTDCRGDRTEMWQVEHCPILNKRE